MNDGAGRSLTRRQFDAVIRRAAELAVSDPEGGDGALTEVELLRIARDVGLSESHIRMALAEVRSGVAGGGPIVRVFCPESIRASRVVPGGAEEITAQVEDFLVAGQLLQRVGRGIEILQYRPAVDWVSQLARAASFSFRKHYIAAAESVEVRLERVDDGHTLVDFFVDPGMRRNYIRDAIIGGGIPSVIVAVISSMGMMELLPFGASAGVGVVAGAALWTVIGYSLGREHKKKLHAVRLEVEGVLDALEHGESLEPPPASWRRWVKRHFHGVARDLRGSEER